MLACITDRIMFGQLFDMLVAKVKDNIWALFICIHALDIDSGGLKLIESDADVHALYDLAKKKHDIRKKHAGNMFVEELVAWAEEEARSPYLRSTPLKS
nr:transposase, MuDR, MULE transposase domain protein [Tanacetum cinerariifolium]